MLETAEKPHTNIVWPEQAEKILQILKDSGNWMSRSEIAKELEKNTLNPGEMAYLEIMTLNDIVYEKKSPIRTPTGFQWVYKAVELDSK